MRIFDGHNRLLRAAEDGLWVGATFLSCPPMAPFLGPTGIVLVEPLRVHLEIGETPETPEAEIERLRVRYLGERVAVGSGV